MHKVRSDIADGNLWQALIRLWLLAESSVDGAQRMAAWYQATYEVSTHKLRVDQLVSRFDRLGQGDTLTEDEVDLPLAVIEALDRHLGEEPVDTFRPGLIPELRLDGVTYWLVRRDWPPKPSTPASRQHPNLEAWFRYFRVVPSRVALGGASLDVTIKPLLAIGDVVPVGLPVRAHVTHFEDGVALHIEEDPERESFVVTGLNDGSQRRHSLRQEFEFAVGHNAAVWVAPELSVTPDLASEVRAWLAELPEPARPPLLTVPGSFHVQLPERPGVHVNRAVVLDGVGRQVARHDKLTCFSYTLPADDAGPAATFTERIQACRRIELLATPIGLIGVAICKDFSDAATELVHTAWNLLAPDWLLVPSMGKADTVKLHFKRAEEHWKLRGVRSVVANQAPATVGVPQPEPAPGFIYPEDELSAGGPKAPKSSRNLKLVKPKP